MADIRKLIKEEVLEKARLMSLATQDDGGVWVADVVFVFDDEFSIYWMSEEKVRHSQAIIENPNVAAAITLTSKPGEPNIGIQLAGTAEKLEGDSHELSTKLLAKRNKPAPEPGKGILGSGKAWYKITPKFIELKYEPLFKFEKQRLDL